jgi:uracil-DNA glycosylase family 4
VKRREYLQLLQNPSCDKCRLHLGADDICIMGKGNTSASIMVVGRMPNSGEYQATLVADLEEAGLDTTKMYFTSAVKCRNFAMTAGKTQLKVCFAEYLLKEIQVIKPEWILVMGNEALSAVTGHSGITTYRGKVIEKHGCKVVPTISPMAVSRNPGQRQSYIADLHYFAAQVFGKGASIPEPEVTIVDTREKLKALKQVLDGSELLSYDIETFSTPAGSEFAPDAQIVSLAGTSISRMSDTGELKLLVWAIPLAHPASVFRKSWQQVLRFLGPSLEAIPKQIAHNGKYDARWMRQFGVKTEVTYDTMLACHLLNENLPKGLKFQAQNRFGVSPWAISTKDLRTAQLSSVLHYNALDTYYTYHLYLDTKKQLIAQPRLARLFKLIMTPANNILIDVERRGVWMDREKLQSHHQIALKMREEINDELAKLLPDMAEETGWPVEGKKGKPREINWNPSIFLRWFVFEWLGLPILARGKPKDDGTPGDPSVAEDVMLALKLDPGHAAVDLLLERSKWQKYCSAFLSAYEELLDETDRIHTTFKLYGTVTGRLSSGKAEQDKITARAPVRGVNLQQVPRDDFIRGLFGSAPGYTFVEADFSQIELRVAAFLSRDKTMLHLYQTDQDIHRATASWVLGIPMERVSKDDRKKAKAVNFGFVYGMGAKKFVHTAFTKYDMVFTLEEAEDVRKAFFNQFRGLQPWHARQRRLVADHRRVQSPLGRVRHLPDIDSGDRMVRGEAERQAINSPVQSFASDLTMLSMVLLEDQLTVAGVQGHFISTVHDALLFEIRDDHVRKALPIIKDTMENLPLKRKFGVVVDVPIKVDLKVGRYWGDARELEPSEVYAFQPE